MLVFSKLTGGAIEKSVQLDQQRKDCMEVGFLDTGSTPVRSTFCEIADKAIAGDYECNLGDIKSVTPRALIKQTGGTRVAI